MSARLTVLYIAGSGRSGSTIIDNVLGEASGVLSAGELRFLWDRNLRDNRVCGCGRPFSGCPFWRAVLRRAFGDVPPDPARVVAWRDEALPLRLTPVAGLPRVRRRLTRRHAPYLEVLERLYHAAAGVAGARVVVDSSKYPAYGYLLSLVDSLDVRMVHLVRDPRAVAHSWTRRKLETTTAGVRAPMARQAPGRTALDWMLWAVLAELYGRAMPAPTVRVRYEDFASRPRETVRLLLRHAGLPDTRPACLVGAAVRLSGNHTVGGNPGRMRAGLVPVHLDEEWRVALSPRHRREVTAVAWPGMLRYGYLGGLR